MGINWRFHGRKLSLLGLVELINGYVRLLNRQLPLKIHLSSRDGGDLVNIFDTATFIVSVPNQDLDSGFQILSSWSF